MLEFNQVRPRRHDRLSPGLRRRHLELRDRRRTPRRPRRRTLPGSVTTPSAGCSSICGGARASMCSGVGIDADAPTGIYFVTHGAHGHEFSYLRRGSAAARMRAGRSAARGDSRVQSPARVGHQPGDQRQRVRHRVRGDRRGTRGRRQHLLRFQPSAQAVAAGARAGGDRGDHSAVRLVLAEPRRGRAAFPASTNRRRSSIGATRAAHRWSR